MTGVSLKFTAFISWNNKTVFILFQKIEKKREEENCKSGFIIEERKKAIDRIKMHKIVIFLIIIILHPKQNPWNMVQEIQVLSWNMHKMWMVNRIPTLSFFLFFGSQWQYRYKQAIINLHRLASTQEIPHTIAKINNNINIDSTAVGSVNAHS